MIEASEARETGLVTEVVAADALVDRAVALGEELADRPLASMRLIRTLLAENAHEGDIAVVQRREGDALREAYASPEHHEAVAAFLGKRTPNFSAVRGTR
jgi:2-(1,2-epoxy-1,2-dihydrophenyl)acetyl-CoA isomerase